MRPFTVLKVSSKASLSVPKDISKMRRSVNKKREERDSSGSLSRPKGHKSNQKKLNLSPFPCRSITGSVKTNKPTSYTNSKNIWGKPVPPQLQSVYQKSNLKFQVSSLVP
ncbi:hypothetical protein ABW19_dt0209497 [Dactylella cylindrospora]|nr:hypothetical protein ABW19_dt0209497 [Dactylella cylindrospora]